jgi:hypothetical protein
LGRARSTGDTVNDTLTVTIAPRMLLLTANS